MRERSADNGTAELAGDVADSLAALVRALPGQRGHHVGHLIALAKELRRVVCGAGTRSVSPRDRRFDHPAWHSRGLRSRALQAWLSTGAQYERWLDGLNVAEPDRARLRQIGGIADALLAPSNTLLNPQVLERLRETRGASVYQGVWNLAVDLILQQPVAPLCAETAFHVGRDLANTAGEVILREPLFELIQYRPTTDETHVRPLLIVPPPLNRFYLLDLNENTSLVRHALDQGLQVFLISWRNPVKSQAEWGFHHYVHACDQAMESVSKVAGNVPVSLLGVCAGGLLGLLLQGVLNGRDQAERMCAASYLVTPVDARLDTGLLRMLGPAARQRLRTRVWRYGYLPIADLARAFSWQRPAEFVCPQALDRYAMGQDPTPRDILFWSQDCTRLPARLVDDLLDYFERDPFARPGSLVLQECAIDLSTLATPSWHLGAQHDHIVPFANSFPANRVGGEKTYVQSHSGHIQSLVNPSDHPGAWFRAGRVGAGTVHDWLVTNEMQKGSWRTHWSAWLKRYSGSLQTAPSTLGNSTFPPLQPAPGRYVHHS